jgi:hypothetical protein
MDVLKGIAVGVLLLASNAAVAQSSDLRLSTEDAAAEVQAVARDIPAGVRLVNLERWYDQRDTFSDNPYFPVGQTQVGVPYGSGVLGLISYAPFEGGHPLYQCYTTNNYNKFTSTDVHCEGRSRFKGREIIGYISSTQREGTFPLYRCFQNYKNWGDHFDTTNPNCDDRPGTQRDAVIGYIWL